MKTFRLGLAALATFTLAAGAAGGAGRADAADDRPIAAQVLDVLCRAKGGTAHRTPMTLARCQEARAYPGFTLERLVCEALLDGSFASAPSYGRPSRTTWVCAVNG